MALLYKKIVSSIVMRSRRHFRALLYCFAIVAVVAIALAAGCAGGPSPARNATGGPGLSIADPAPIGAPVEYTGPILMLSGSNISRNGTITARITLLEAHRGDDAVRMANRINPNLTAMGDLTGFTRYNDALAVQFRFELVNTSSDKNHTIFGASDWQLLTPDGKPQANPAWLQFKPPSQFPATLRPGESREFTFALLLNRTDASPFIVYDYNESTGRGAYFKAT
jgi:hypothetical protein